jgi:hypothetical protein
VLRERGGGGVKGASARPAPPCAEACAVARALPAFSRAGSFGSQSRSLGSGAGSYGARGAAIAEDEEELEHDEEEHAELLLMLRTQSAAAGGAPLSRSTLHFERRTSAASFDDDRSEDGREESPGAFVCETQGGRRRAAAPCRGGLAASRL